MQEINPQTILDSVQGFAWLSTEARLIMAKMSRLALYDSGEIVFQGTEKSESIYIVISGNLQVLRCMDRGEQLETVLYEKDTFDLSFLFDRGLSHEVLLVASMPSLVLSIPVKESQDWILTNPEDKEIYLVLKEYYEAYAFIGSSTTFGDQLSPRYLVEFSSSFEKKTYKVDEYIFRQGDDPDGYYICINGLLEVIVEVNGKVVFTTDLKPGDYFGELALTTDAKRAASIKAKNASECYFLSRQEFDDLVKKETQIMEGFKTLAKLAYG